MKIIMGNKMKINAKISFEYVTENYATIAFNSLQPDNIGYIKSYTDNKSLICCINGDSIGRVLATADDLIFCSMMVEKIAELDVKP